MHLLLLVFVQIALAAAVAARRGGPPLTTAPSEVLLPALSVQSLFNRPGGHPLSHSYSQPFLNSSSAEIGGEKLSSSLSKLHLDDSTSGSGAGGIAMKAFHQQVTDRMPAVVENVNVVGTNNVRIHLGAGGGDKLRKKSFQDQVSGCA